MIVAVGLTVSEVTKSGLEARERDSGRAGMISVIW
jgi:hypothetical protein